MSTPSKGGRQRARKSWFSRHRHMLETAGEAIAIDFGWAAFRRVVLPLLAVGTASAAITLATSTSTVPAVHPTQPLSTKGAALITRFEGVRYQPYNDAREACTEGVGHLMHLGPCTRAELALRLTPAQTTALLMHDASSATACVHAAVTRKLTTPEDDALISFTFNVGCGGLRQSQALRDVNAGLYSSITGDLERWSYAGGVYLAGLHTRRLAEAHLFLTGDYGPGIGVYIAPKPVPAAVARLRAKTGYYAWLSWYLGREGWKRYGPHNPKVRPHVAVTVAKGWWRREAAFVKAEQH